MSFIHEGAVENLFCYPFSAQPDNFAFRKANIFSGFDNDTVNIIVHQTNCMGIMGAGIAKQIKDRYPGVFEHYQSHCINCKEEIFGTTQVCNVGENWESIKMIANLFGQKGLGWGDRQTDYEAFYKGLEDLKRQLEEIEKDFPPNNKKLSIAFPYKIGCGIAGGEWNIIYNMIYSVFGDDGSDARHVYFYVRPEDYNKEMYGYKE